MQQVKLDNSPIVYYISRCDNADWILFLHAGFANHQMFETQIDYFKNKYNILMIDIIGHGQSTHTRKGDSIDKTAIWIKEILDKENIDKLHVVGFCLGAVLAQDFANRYPDNVNSLACIGGYDINNFDAALQKENGSAHMRMMLKAFISIKWFAKENKKLTAYTEMAQNQFYNMNIEFPKKSFMYLASLNSMVNIYKTGKRNYPLLIGCGEKDYPLAISAQQMWANNEPDCIVKIFKNAGHCVNMDVPQEFNEAMETFWNVGQ